MPATDTRTSLGPARPAVGTAAGLRAALRDIDAEGWQSRSGNEVLLYARGQILGQQLSLEDLAAHGWEPAAAVNQQPELGPRLQVIADALVSVGWQHDQVDALLEWIASRAGGTPGVQRRHLLFDEIATHLQ